MLTKSRSIYSRARIAAGITQEDAADTLHISVRALADYESGQRRPPAQTVEQMAALYQAQGLRLDHARETDELGIIPREAIPLRIERAAIRLALKHRAASRFWARLLEIAEDGQVDAGEADDFSDIQAFVASVVADCLALEACESAKKERPTAATVKRPRSEETLMNNSKAIIAKLPSKCKPNFSSVRGCGE